MPANLRTGCMWCSSKARARSTCCLQKVTADLETLNAPDSTAAAVRPSHVAAGPGNPHTAHSVTAWVQVERGGGCALHGRPGHLRAPVEKGGRPRGHAVSCVLWTQPWEGRKAGQSLPGAGMLFRLGQMQSCGAASLSERCQVCCRRPQLQQLSVQAVGLLPSWPALLLPSRYGVRWRTTWAWGEAKRGSHPFQDLLLLTR